MDLMKLVELQEIDARLLELESFKGDLPEQVGKLRNRLSEINQDLAKTKTELENATKQKRTIESDIKTFTEKLNKYQEQIYSVKTNKEYDAITVEIETIENKIDETELSGVELLEKEETYNKEVALFEEKLSEHEKHLAKRETELKEKLDQTETEEQFLLSKRNDIKKLVKPRIFASYERIRKGRDGIAIAVIENYNCTGCYTTLPAQMVVEVRKMERIINCEVCGRILVPNLNKKTEENQEEKVTT